MMKSILPWIAAVMASCQDLPQRMPTLPESTSAAMRPSEEEPRVASDEGLGKAYLIHPGDELRFVVLGQPDLSFDARVPADGAIDYPLIGRLRLAGRTPEEARGELAERLGKDYLAAPEVSIFVKEYARRYVYILGAVSAPREYEVPNGGFVTLLQIITRSGGFLEDAAKHSVSIFRRREEGSPGRMTISVNVRQIQEGLDRDPTLLPGDIVFVPAREKVYVLGQVARPGAFVVDADHGLTAHQAISLAGGFTRIANDANVRLIRRDQKGARMLYVLNLANVANGRPEDDVPLQPGDLLFVPESFF
ncbi:MAG: polysaccharide biosynthesis/export family protein [Planctomycetes bacterium]|nr:polysaccharide biosynthesis/export family protein [Planctomycetota bacterium]